MIFTLGQPPAPVHELVLEYAERLVSQDPLKFVKALPSLQITDQGELGRVLRKLCDRSPMALLRNVHKLGLHDQSELLTLAIEAAARVGAATSSRIENFGIADPLARAQVAVRALQKDRKTINEFKHYQLPEDILLSHVLKPFFDDLTSGSRIKLDFDWLRNSFLRRAASASHLRYSLGIGVSDDEMYSLAPHERLARAATWLRNHYDGFSDEIFSYQNEVRAEELIYDTLAATIACWRVADVTRYGNRARASLAALTGYESIPAGNMSSNSLRELYGAVLTAYHTFGPDVATVVPVDLGNTARGLRVLSLATATKMLDGTLPIFSGTIATSEQYDEAEQICQQHAVAACKERLGIKSLPERDAIAELWDFWGGDLTPLMILAGRYNSQTDWQSALLCLSDVASRPNSSFYSWRYRQDDGQLSMFSDTQQQRWRENPIHIARHTAGRTVDIEPAPSIREHAASTFKSEILAYLPRAIAEAIHSDPLHRTNAESLLLLQEREFSRVSLANAVRLLAHVVTYGNDSDTIRVVKLINGAKERLLKDPNIEHRNELSKSFKALHQLTNTGKTVADNQYYVVSVITDHPKLLLMVGDLVEAGSCQNYRTGLRADTLVDYAIDGYVKLALSYVVRASVYDKIVPKKADISFDAATQSLVIQGHETRLKLGYAVRREILRAGKIIGDSIHFGEPVCAIEQSEAQNHVIADFIQAQQTQLIADYLQNCGIHIASRNQGVSHPTSRRRALDEARRKEQDTRPREYRCC